MSVISSLQHPILSFDQHRDARVQDFSIVSSTAALRLPKSCKEDILLGPTKLQACLTNRASLKRGNPPNRR